MKDPQSFPVRLFHSSPAGLLPFDRKSLAECIPLARPGLATTPSTTITYATYLRGIERFITENREFLTQAVSHQMSCSGRSIVGVDVVTEKHGSDYHPARLLVRSGDSVHAFVVNTAVSERGMSRLKNEFQVLQYLRSQYRREFVPRMYVLANVTVTDESGGQVPMAMALGEWFDGFHEFHLSERADTSVPGTVLWDMNRGYVFLEDREAQEIYSQAAFILTYYYDCETFHEIFPWHHAAGDFVVSRFQETIDVRLITARQYAQRLTLVDRGRVNRLDALLAFVANLTIRMRLDRLDGVGEMAWAGDHCVEGTVRGVVDALKAKVALGTCDTGLLEAFLESGRTMSPAGWAELLSRTSESYDEDAPDVPVIREHMVDHIFRVYKAVQSIR